jgi:hypothetical protein
VPQAGMRRGGTRLARFVFSESDMNPTYVDRDPVPPQSATVHPATRVESAAADAPHGTGKSTARREGPAASSLVEAAEVIGAALGRWVSRLDAWSGRTPDPAGDVNELIQRAREEAIQVPHPPDDKKIGSLGEIAHLRASDDPDKAL